MKFARALIIGGVLLALAAPVAIADTAIQDEFSQ